MRRRGAGAVARTARAGGGLRRRDLLGARSGEAARASRPPAHRGHAGHTPRGQRRDLGPEARDVGERRVRERCRLHRGRPADSRRREPARRGRGHPGDHRRLLPMSRTLENDLLVRALLREPVPRTPVWIMRQAGRYLPEYREVRARAGDFMTLCRTPELACEVTLQPLRRFALDAAILFSDILVIPDAMGLGLFFVEGEGPRFREPVRSASAIRRLGVPDPADDLGYVLDAVRLVRAELGSKAPLIGFAGSPWTVATYMVEGGASREFGAIRALAAENAAALEHLLGVLARATTDYLNAQVAAGVDAVMVFDTWGGVLPPDEYRRFSLSFMQRIV